MKTIYPSDLTDAQWRIIARLIPPAKSGGCPRKTDMRALINGILYLNRSGCSWRMLPRDFPPWSTVHWYYRHFRLIGVWDRIHETLRGKVRKQVGRKESPSAAMIDSQSVKTAGKGGTEATMRAKKSLAANDILSWIPWV
jgi:putative transposase